MPGEQNDGFAYLDASREAYTDEKADESINTVPTEAQLTRINRMYPQYRRHLRDTGFSEMEEVEEAYDVVYEIDFTKETEASKFEPTHLVDVKFDEEKGISFRSDAGDSYFFVNFEEIIFYLFFTLVNAKIFKFPSSLKRCIHREYALVCTIH